MKQVRLYVQPRSDGRLNTNQSVINAVATMGPVVIVDRTAIALGVNVDIAVVSSAKEALKCHAEIENATIVVANFSRDEKAAVEALASRMPRIVAMGQNLMMSLLGLIGKKSEEKEAQPHVPSQAPDRSKKRAKGLKILLVDDSFKHRRAGIEQLQAQGHEVTAVCGYTEALELAKQGGFDAALIDLLMPAESTTLSPTGCVEFLGKEVAVGFPLLMALSLAGIPRIAVATDTNHHAHPMSASVDWFIGSAMHINGSIALVMHSPMLGEVKDWGTVLARLLAAEPG